MIFIHCLLLWLTFLIETGGNDKSYHNFPYKSPDIWGFFKCKAEVGTTAHHNICFPPLLFFIYVCSKYAYMALACVWVYECICVVPTWTFAHFVLAQHLGLANGTACFAWVVQINGKSLSLFGSCRDGAQMCFGMWVCVGLKAGHVTSFYILCLSWSSGHKFN